MRTTLFLMVMITSTLLPACNTISKSDHGSVEQLVSWMTGSFNSNKQSISDKQYFDINLEMHRIWYERTDGYWLYVEQAVSSSLDRPYRQRIYHITEVASGQYESKVFSLAEPEKYIGAYSTKGLFENLSPKVLLERIGCSVFLNYKEGVYSGSTRNNSCTSKLRGASYATSIVSVFPDKIDSWDQGFNSNGEQVWGAVKGAYIFNRK